MINNKHYIFPSKVLAQKVITAKDCFTDGIEIPENLPIFPMQKYPFLPFLAIPIFIRKGDSLHEFLQLMKQMYDGYGIYTV